MPAGQDIEYNTALTYYLTEYISFKQGVIVAMHTNIWIAPKGTRKLVVFVVEWKQTNQQFVFIIFQTTASTIHCALEKIANEKIAHED